jgi:aspartate racemase
MAGHFYPEVFTRRGITVLAPRPDDQEYVHDKYMRELIPGDFRSETRAEFVVIIERLRQGGAEGVLLAGTELPLLLRDAADCGVPLLDTTRIHVDRAVTEMLS